MRVGIIYGCIGDRIIHFLEEGIYIQREEQKSIVYIVVNFDPREFVVLHVESNLR